KLVSAYRSLRTNLPYLFTYKKYKHLGIHNTTNSLDGGYSQIAIADFLQVSLSLVSKVLREEM
ncbi:MAG: transposase, partial [Sulfurovum sp.]|nr:transposase [Sulfurovum sp.]